MLNIFTRSHSKKSIHLTLPNLTIILHQSSWFFFYRLDIEIIINQSIILCSLLFMIVLNWNYFVTFSLRYFAQYFYLTPSYPIFINIHYSVFLSMFIPLFCHIFICAPVNKFNVLVDITHHIVYIFYLTTLIQML